MSAQDQQTTSGASGTELHPDVLATAAVVARILARAKERKQAHDEPTPGTSGDRLDELPEAA